MTFDSIEQIRALIEHPLNKQMLIRAQEIRIKHELHVSGIGLDSYIDKIQGIENENAVSLRRALGKVITESETNKIISVQEKIFTARGGGRFYDFTNENDQKEFTTQILGDVKNNISMKNYMKKVWKELVNVDPNGLIMAEITEDGESVDLTYKSSDSLHDIGYKGAQKIEYIIFKPIVDKKENAKFYRVIDDAFDYLIKVQANDYSVVEDETFPNPWGFVPATFISDRFDKKSNGWNTHIYECMNHADDLLLDYTIYKVYKTRVAIPASWEYARECGHCEGSGTTIDKDSQEQGNCLYCGGRGTTNHNRDVSEIYVLPIPETDDVPLNPPKGYVIPDLETWAKSEDTQEKIANKMYQAVWGESSVIDIDRRNITAAELVVRDNSKETRLNEISDNEENVEKRLTDILGLFYYPNTYEGAIVSNGRHYITKTAKQLQDEYNDAVKEEINSTYLTELLADLYHTIYRNSPQKLNESLVKLNTKPFFHWNPDKLQEANVAEKDYYKNLYYDEFVVWYNLNVEPFGITTIDNVNKALDKWIVDKIPVDENAQDKDSDEAGGFTQEQMESQANLRGSVGGVQGILETQSSVQEGTTDYDAALEILKEIYGFNEEKARKILGTPSVPTVPIPKINENIQDE